MLYTWFNTMVRGYLKYRYSRVQKMYTEPKILQEEQLEILLENLNNTKYLKNHSSKPILNYTDFRQFIPIVEYEQIFPFVSRMMSGEEDVLWPEKTLWYAKSSGTTNDKSKYIPITEHNLFENHITASWDAMSILYQLRPGTKVFDRKNLIMGGSLSKYPENPDVVIGDVSAILLNRMPMIGRPFYSPDFNVALLSDWEEKIEKMTNICIEDDIVMFAGVPTWTIVLFKKILEKTGKKHMLEVWPNLKTYLHGGVSFEPYIEQFKELIPSDDFTYLEVYNASEGYFAIQDQLDDKSMLLLLDNAIFYEFLPFEFYGTDQYDKAVPLWEVEKDKTYCIVVSTSSGLWRYMPGDTVVFTNTNPYRIKIVGRTKHFINVFGEEVMVSNTDQALRETCLIHHAKVNDYTVAPIFLDGTGKGGHQWLIEFEVEPTNLEAFAKTLDDELKKINSDYEAKRHKDIALQNLTLTNIPNGTFKAWLKSKGKLGGQSKIPRLSNQRTTLEQILTFIQQK